VDYRSLKLTFRLAVPPLLSPTANAWGTCQTCLSSPCDFCLWAAPVHTDTDMAVTYFLGTVAWSAVNFDRRLTRRRHHDKGGSRDTSANSSVGKWVSLLTVEVNYAWWKLELDFSLWLNGTIVKANLAVVLTIMTAPQILSLGLVLLSPALLLVFITTVLLKAASTLCKGV